MPPPMAIPCDLCGQQFFKRSLPIHRKQCEKKYQQCFTECKKCLRKVSNDEIDKHQAECKVVRKKPMPKPKIVKERPIAQAKREPKDGEDSSSSEESSDEEDHREECGFCNRKFNPDRIAKHESVCATNAGRKQRKQFKSASQARLENTDFQQYADPDARRRADKLPSCWRQDHERLHGIVEQGRLVKVFKEAGVSLTELPAQGADLKKIAEDGDSGSRYARPEDVPVPEGMKRCPHCSRSFALETASKHIPKCKTTVNKPKMLVRKSKPMLEKPKGADKELVKELVKKVLAMTSKKTDFFETKEASMFREGEAVLTPDGRKGTVRYIGRVSQLFPGYWIGVELNEANGNNDGSIQGGMYFKCSPNHGVFMRPSKLRRPQPPVPEPAPNNAGAADRVAGDQAGPSGSKKAAGNKEQVAGEAPKSATQAAAPGEKQTKKEGLVERLRDEVRRNSPREPAKKRASSNAASGASAAASAPGATAKEQRPEVDEQQPRHQQQQDHSKKKAPKQKEAKAEAKPKRTAAASNKKASEAEITRQQRLEKDVKFLEAMYGKGPSQLAGGAPREEAAAAPRSRIPAGGHKLGSSGPASSAGSKAAGPGKAGQDREARAAYFERMFAQRQQESGA
mmetsp:Transcript_14654/g.37084  ORF Transcript_14654/g.37084 Transcript_14654/m.37084 type:complete len:625 (+) Transcript_14654:182-2056(+)